MFECVKRFLRDFLRNNVEIKTVEPKPKKFTLYPEDYLKEAMRITGAFEGSGYGNVAGNFDGQGISAGMLQWNYGQGTLQNKILHPFIKRHGELELDNHFPGMVSHTAYMPPKQAVRYASVKMLDDKKLKRQWDAAWREFMFSSRVQELQLEAAEELANKAWAYCEQHDMKSIKAFCWFFDIVVQNGSLKGAEKPLFLESYPEEILADAKGFNLEVWRKIETDKETKTLFIWTCDRVTRNKWASDVIARKGTIAHGTGYVHGNLYNLDDIFKKYV